MDIRIEKETKSSYAGVCIASVQVQGITVKDSPQWLLDEMENAMFETKTAFGSKSLLGDPVIKAYRTFLKGQNIDPSKIRSSGEALIRMALNARKLPHINGVVDSMNLCSARTGISASAFDRNMIVGDVIVRLARKGEQYMAHGNHTYSTSGGELVITDEEKILCLYPYRDNVQTMITRQTKNAVLQTHGVPGIDPQLIKSVLMETLRMVLATSAGYPSDTSLLMI